MEDSGLDNEFVSTRYGVLRVAHFVSIKTMENSSLLQSANNKIASFWGQFLWKRPAFWQVRCKEVGDETELQTCVRCTTGSLTKFGNGNRASKHTHGINQVCASNVFLPCAQPPVGLPTPRFAHVPATCSPPAPCGARPYSGNKLSFHQARQPSCPSAAYQNPTFTIYAAHIANRLTPNNLSSANSNLDRLYLEIRFSASYAWSSMICPIAMAETISSNGYQAMGLYSQSWCLSCFVLDFTVSNC